MQYCPKCGIKIDDTATFCLNCGTQLKGAAPSQAPPTEPSEVREKAEQNAQKEKNEYPEKAGKQKKVEHAFIYFLAEGLILITIAVFAMFELTNPALMSGQYLAIMLVIIGLIVVLAAVYAVFSGRKSPSSKLSNEPEKKQPITTAP